MTQIRPKERDAVIKSLRAGVVPRYGQHLIQVGRKKEIETLISDIACIADGGSCFRLVIGEYGSGKTFFLNLIRSIGIEKKLVVANADLNPDRRLHSSGGQARSLYAELMRNMCTRTKPDGGALGSIVEKFIIHAKSEADSSGLDIHAVIQGKLDQIKEMVSGYDFADVIAAYCKGFEDGNEQLKSDAIKWLRGEFSTKTDAKHALGVRSIIDDASIYDQLKLLALFVRLAGYAGLLINLDEMVNIYKLANVQSRNSNYEQILRILNDSLQGNTVGLGFILGGTKEFLTDTRRGLYSYPALQSRLSQNSFATNGLIDFNGPVIQLSSLDPENFYVLLENIRHVYAAGEKEQYLLPDKAITGFMEYCHNKIGNAYFKTPRTTIISFIDLLAVLEQNPQAKWEDLLGSIKIESDAGAIAELSVENENDEMASFQM